jgi:FkbM family methyltransferase
MSTLIVQKTTRAFRRAALSPLRLIPEDSIWPILTGPLRGKRWIVGSSRRACWLGLYERHFQKVLCQQLKPGAVFYDIGANVGFYSLLASGLVQSGQVYSFEPVPRNVAFLRRHVELNQLTNVRILEVAVADHEGSALFQESEDPASGHLGNGELRVSVTSVDSLLERNEISFPDCIKIDVEGAELKALLGARNCLMRYKPTIFLATHGVQVHADCHRLLDAWGFTFQPARMMPEGRADVVVRPRNGHSMVETTKVGR